MSLQVSNPVLLTLICVIENGGLDKEKEVHVMFNAYRLMGEWFSPNNEILAFTKKFPYLGVTVNKGRELENNSNWKGNCARDETKRARIARRVIMSDCENCGHKGYDRHNKSGDLNNYLSENFMILCRKCCMEKDGRLESFKELAKLPKIYLRKEPVECRICHEIKKHHSHGRCKNCDNYFRNHGIERSVYLVSVSSSGDDEASETFGRAAPSRQGQCRHPARDELQQ